MGKDRKQMASKSQQGIANSYQKKQSLLAFNRYSSELKSLNIATRNKVRAILSSDGNHALRLINNLREEKNSHEIVKIEKALRLQVVSGKAFIPEIFPEKPQTSESYVRLLTLPIEKHLNILERLCLEHKETLNIFFDKLLQLNSHISSRELNEADRLIGEITQIAGYSHLLMRKAALIKSVNNEEDLPESNKLFSEAGLGSNNTIASSALQSFQEEQDFLIMKRSIMSIRDKGASNKFTRDIARLSFHPHSKDEDDLCEMLQSNLQSSIIDALIILKINKRKINIKDHEEIIKAFSSFDSVAHDIDEIAKNYIEDGGEDLFYKHSSAWLENDQIVTYRALQDHFNDSPESEYLNLDDSLSRQLNEWVMDISLSELAEAEKFTKHNKANLSKLEKDGLTSRSSVYNFINHLKQGCELISEEKLISLMGKTKDLHKTISISHHKNLAINAQTTISRIIIYFLVAKKSRNERDNYSLRRHIQSVVKQNHQGSLLEFIKSLANKSKAVAIYAYETCTEDFIAKLPHLIETPYQITKTRASLHQWMGDLTGEQSYKDRARALLIDHQINRIRNEIDDNRIYVDSARFSEWVNDEIIRDLDAILSSMEHNKTLEDAHDPQLFHIIEKCYSNFCQNNIFGIASYLGRRIRHGTFKGHLYSSVVAVEDNYTNLLRDSMLSKKWDLWKKNYEACIEKMIREHLHVESSSKANGLIKPNIKDAGKSATVIACSNKLIAEYNETKTSASASYILTEYCWRLIEFDLRNIKSFLKGKKSELVQSDLLSEFKYTADMSQQNAARDFARDVQRHVNDKLLAMYGWFNRPASVSPKASVFLLYKAVVAEVRETYPNLKADTDFDEELDIVLAGGAYHVLYDAFYVVVFNAAKHGKTGADVIRDIEIVRNSVENQSAIVVTISSQLADDDSEAEVLKRLRISPNENIENAHLFEGRSGIRKLYHLQRSDSNFKIQKIECQDRHVSIGLVYKLEHI